MPFTLTNDQAFAVVVIVSDPRIIERNKAPLSFHLMYDIHDGFTEPYSSAIRVNTRCLSLAMGDIMMLLILGPYLKGASCTGCCISIRRCESDADYAVIPRLSARS
jgi:hypothetical protein